VAEPLLILSKKAEDDLDAIAGFIAQRDGAARAVAITERIWKSLRNLAVMPGIGSRKPYLDEHMRAFSVAPWTVYYVALPDGDGVEITRILDGRRDLPSLFEKKK
jgi:plasmid stabilization system protein ParE